MESILLYKNIQDVLNTLKVLKFVYIHTSMEIKIFLTYTENKVTPLPPSLPLPSSLHKPHMTNTNIPVDDCVSCKRYHDTLPCLAVPKNQNISSLHLT